MKRQFITSLLASVALVIILSVASCGGRTLRQADITEKETVIDSCRVITLPKGLLPIDLLTPTDLIAIDTFLLVFQHHEDKMVNVYSTRTFQFLGNFLRKGGGPNEVNVFGKTTQHFIENGESKVVIHTYPLFTGVLNIRKSLEAKQTVFDYQYKYETKLGQYLMMNANYAYLLDSNRLLMSERRDFAEPNADTNRRWKCYDYANDTVTHQIVYENFPLGSNSFLTSSDVSFKPDRTKAAMFYRFFDRMSIADLCTGEVKQFQRDGKPHYAYAADEGRRSVYYEGSSCTNQYIFGLYAGGLNAIKSMKMETKPSTLLHIFDWEGNFRYQMDMGEEIRMIAVDERQQYIYAVAASDSIYRYDLSGLNKE